MAQGKRLPQLTVLMKTQATELNREQGRVVGVKARTEQGETEIRAGLTVAANGRHSLLREQAGLELRDLGAPIDVLWFRVRRNSHDADQTLTHVGEGKVLITLDRGDYWQCAYVIPKGGVAKIRQRGLDALRTDIALTGPELAPYVRDIDSWDDVKLLEVKVNRLDQWSTSGFLCIGDAAHAMSPIGGVGINLAIQDAVATANMLAKPLLAKTFTEDDLAAVQRRREFPAKVTQGVQIVIQKQVIDVLLHSDKPLKAPWILKLLSSVPLFRRIPAYLVGVGVRPEHIR